MHGYVCLEALCLACYMWLILYIHICMESLSMPGTVELTHKRHKQLICVSMKTQIIGLNMEEVFVHCI